MLINADFSKRALVIPADQDWVLSPASGVERLMLDRVGDEVARATSIVRYAPGSSFERHTHAEGEEFLVLQGIFSDEHGDYPAGTYVRNPPGSGHSPFSTDGCTILVKLRQFDLQDLKPVVLDTADQSVWPGYEDEILLHEFSTERVVMHRLKTGVNLQLGTIPGGAEAFLVQGALDFEDALLSGSAWFRMPPGDRTAVTAQEDSIVLLKTGHLTALL